MLRSNLFPFSPRFHETDRIARNKANIGGCLWVKCTRFTVLWRLFSHHDSHFSRGCCISMSIKRFPESSAHPSRVSGFGTTGSVRYHVPHGHYPRHDDIILGVAVTVPVTWRSRASVIPRFEDAQIPGSLAPPCLTAPVDTFTACHLLIFSFPPFWLPSLSC